MTRERNTKMCENVIDVSFEHPEDEKAVGEEEVERRLGRILPALGVKPPVEFSVSFVDDERIHALNKQWRHVDRPTDILTFVQADDASFPGFPGEEKTLGDMVISLSSMRENAEAFGVSEDEELWRLLVHGTLHLLGYDHATDDVEKEPMLQKQEALLVSLGVKA